MTWRKSSLIHHSDVPVSIQAQVPSPRRSRLKELLLKNMSCLGPTPEVVSD